MKFKENSNPQELIGDIESNEFKISDSSSPMIMEALINLYSNPISSIVREITSNCLDAHTERDLKLEGKKQLDEGDNITNFSTNKNIEIEYSESNILLGLDESIIFRDFGIGMSPQRVKEVYTVFGASSKRDNNSEIGGWGLGNKSVFSYTDTFYVATVYNNIYYYYMLYKDNKILKMDLVHSESTDLKNKSEVIVPIKKDKYDESEYYKFVNAIEEQLLFIDNITYKNFKSDIKKINKWYENDNMLILDNNDINNTKIASIKKAFILIGNIKYPINFDLIDKNFFKRTSIGLKFDIGVLDLVPSRENIQYTEATINAINNKINTIYKDVDILLQEITKNLEDNQDKYNIIEYLEIYHSIYKKYRSYSTYSFNYFSNLAEVYSYIYNFKNNKNLNKEKDHKIVKYKDIYIYLNLANSNFRFTEIFKNINIDVYYKYNDARASVGFQCKLDRHTSYRKEYPSYFVSDKYSVNKTITLLNKFDKVNLIKLNNNFSIETDDLYNKTLKQIFNSNDVTKHFTNKEIYEFYNKAFEYLKTALKVKNYDDVEPYKNTIVTNSNISKVKYVDEVFCRRITTVKDYNTHNIKFTNTDLKIEDINKNSKGDDLEYFIYGFKEDEKLLLNFAKLLVAKNNFISLSAWEEFEFNKWAIYKIAKNAEKYFIKGHYVRELFMEKFKLIKEYATALKAKEFYIKYEYLYNFEKINKDVYKKYMKVYNYKKEHLQDTPFLDADFKKELLDLCEKENLYDKNILDNISYLEKYCVNLEIFEYMDTFNTTDVYSRVPTNKPIFTSNIKQYLAFRNKAHDAYTKAELAYLPTKIKEPEKEIEVLETSIF